MGLNELNTVPLNLCFNNNNENKEDQQQEFEEDKMFSNPISNPFDGRNQQAHNCHTNDEQHQFATLDILVAVLRKSLVTCSVETEDVSSSMDISSLTDVKHVSHVTFDRFNGFPGLPTELEPEVPNKAWFRKLPTGVLESLTPEQAMDCKTKDDCTNLVSLLPQTEAALLNWAINLWQMWFNMDNKIR